MINFILNNRNIRAHQLPGIVVLEFLRDYQRLTDTKSGCREGDCGSYMIPEYPA